MSNHDVKISSNNRLLEEFNGTFPRELPKVSARLDTLKADLGELRQISPAERAKIEDILMRKRNGEQELQEIQNALENVMTQIGIPYLTISGMHTR